MRSNRAVTAPPQGAEEDRHLPLKVTPMPGASGRAPQAG